MPNPSSSPPFDRVKYSLDVHGQSSPNPNAPSKGNYKCFWWSRQQKRAYHRSMSLLRFWMTHAYQILWITLTSAPTSDPAKLTDHFSTLKKRIERTFGFEDMEHFKISTYEGFGVLHLYLAYKPKPGKRAKKFFIPYEWLKKNWGETHGAWDVWIKRVRNSDRSKKNLSKYCVSQYCANQSLLRHISWSWKRGLGGALVRTYTEIKKFFQSKTECLRIWNRVLSGEEVVIQIPGSALVFVAHPPPHLGSDYMWARDFDHVESSEALEVRSHLFLPRRKDWYIGKKIHIGEGGRVSLL